MTDGSEGLKMAVDANEKMLEDLARWLGDASENSNLALSMALLNQARFMHAGAKWTLQLAQEHESKVKGMAEDQGRTAQVRGSCR